MFVLEDTAIISKMGTTRYCVVRICTVRYGYGTVRRTDL